MEPATYQIIMAKFDEILRNQQTLASNLDYIYNNCLASLDTTTKEKARAQKTPEEVPPSGPTHSEVTEKKEKTTKVFQK